MAINKGHLDTLKSLNPTKRLGLHRSTSGVDGNRIILYGLPSSTTSATVVGTGVTLTGIQWQKAVYTTNGRVFYKPITVTVT